MTKNEVNTQRYIFILGVLAVLGVFLYALRSVLLPFVVGMLAAYFFDPVVQKLANKRMSRNAATLAVISGVLLIVLPLLVLLCGAIFSQIADFAAKVPNYVTSFVQRVTPLLQDLHERFPDFSFGNVEDMVRRNISEAFKLVGKLLSGVIANGFEFINVMSLLVISPVVAFYLLRDWPKITENIMELIPRKNKQSVIDGISAVNKIISGYLRGQVMVCLFLGTFYSCGLMLVGLDLGLLVGFLAGVISFIPYVGSISGFAMAMALVITQYGTAVKIAEVVAVFAIGQFIEGNFLTPKLVGENIGLHPVWVMFALLAGGVLLGLLGMIIAVPVAAIIGVLLSYLIKHYKQSKIYLEK